MAKKEREDLDFEISFYERLLEKQPNYVDALISLAEVYTQKGLYEKGLEADERLARLCPEDPTVHYNLACSRALLGEKEKAIDTLKTAILLGYDDLSHMKKDPDLKSLYHDPEFLRLIQTS